MSESDGCELNCTCRKCKGKKRVIRIEETSDSDDSPVENATKRKKVLRVMSDGAASSSDSDSFNVLVKMKKRKQIPQVMSEDEDSSPVQPRRNGSVRIVSESESSCEYDSSGIDDNEEVSNEEDESGSDSEGSRTDRSYEGSDWESDFSTDQEDEAINGVVPLPVTPVKKPLTNEKAATSSARAIIISDSDSSDGESEKCPICLRSFTSQEVGTPESCDHSFCAMCLQEWAKNVNTCPVDRLPFTLILVRRRVGGKIIRQVAAEAPVPQEENNEDVEDSTFCEACGNSDQEDRMLLCDGCDSGYHMDCLNPPLVTVPIEEWFCPECVVANMQQLSGETGIADGELMDLIDDAHAIGFSPIRPRAHRLLPRTRQTERVRATIRTRVATEAANQPSTSSGIESVDSASRVAGFFGSRPLGAVKKKRKTTFKKKWRVARTKKTKVSKSTSAGVKTAKTKSTAVKKMETKKKTTKRRKKVFESDTYSDDSYSEDDIFVSSSGPFFSSKHRSSSSSD